MSGTLETITSVTSHSNSDVDALLNGNKWSSLSLTYSFPTSGAEYDYTTEKNTFQVVSAAAEDAIEKVLDADLSGSAFAGFTVEGFTNVSFTQTTSTKATLRFGQSDDPSTAWAYYPGTYDAAGDTWFGTSQSGHYMSPVQGTYGWHTIIHEIGHALGLKHGHESPAISASMDSMEFSIMTYASFIGDSTSDGYNNETYGYAQTWMMLDIAALQHMYGADFTTNSGDTTYKWTPGSGDTLVNGSVGIDAGGNVIFATLWDGGGTDLYDLSAYSSDLSIDLAPGGYSVFDTEQLALLHSNGSEVSRGSIFNALQYQGDARSLIENATGGTGDDTISGNSADNKLIGGRGNDSLSGLSGQDDLVGQGGRDVLEGGDDRDKLKGNGGKDTLRGQDGNDTLIGGGGVDKFEFFDGDDKDKIKDFTDDKDKLRLDEDLWGGGLTAQQIVDTYGTEFASKVVLNFGDGDKLTLNGITDLDVLVDDISII